MTLHGSNGNGCSPGIGILPANVSRIVITRVLQWGKLSLMSIWVYLHVRRRHEATASA
jgi:hypothetical protein